MYKLTITIRVVLALIGGYFLTILLSILLSHFLMFVGLSKANATLWAQISSFLIYACIWIWIFAINSLKKVTLQFFVFLIISAILVYFLKKFGI